jgi:hypothetical protein
MADHLKRLENLMRSLSRLPGLGFLSEQADALVISAETFKGTFEDPIEEQMFALESAKQGIREFGTGTLKDLRGPDEDESADSGDAPSTGAAGSGQGSQRSDGKTGDKPIVRSAASTRPRQSKADLRLQKKMLTRKLRG